MLKAVGCDLLPRGVSWETRFRVAAEAGFVGVEMTTVTDPSEVEAIRIAARAAGLRIHSVLALSGGRTPRLHGSTEQIEAGVAAVAASIENAVRWAADTVLVTAGDVDAVTSHDTAYACSQRVLRERVLPLAEARGITLGIENVWYGFLLSPIEYVRYLDELASPRVRAYLDVGNMIFGHPNHWVRAAGSRIARVHLKDFWMAPWGGESRFARPGEGGIDWRALRRAFREVGYTGYVTTTGVPLGRAIAHLDRVRDHLEYRGRLLQAVARPLDALRLRAFTAFLRDLSERFDRFQRTE